jgi:uncharacterized domain 1
MGEFISNIQSIVKEMGGLKNVIAKAKEMGINIVEILNNEIKKEELYKLIGVEILEINEGSAKLIFPYSEKILRRNGMVNGGIIMSVIDLAIGTAVLTVNEGVDQVTAELKINFLEALRKGPFVCEAKVIRAGKTLVVGEAEIYDADRKICTKAIGTWYIIRG